MKYWMLALCFLCAPKLLAGHYEVNPDLSILNFATTKKQYVIEPATITALTGSLDKTGKFVANIDLKHLDTINPVRDNSLRTLFFDYDKYPKIEVAATISPDSLPKTGEIKVLKVAATLTIWNTSKPLELELLAANTGRSLMVSSRKAIVISAADYGIPAENLNKMAGTVGGIAIATSAPVNFQLVLDLKAD
ncbi:YceI family protein [Pseudoteredinibacter isoporae]|uniref:Polyisoprenoid-binding protein YceI n=1 Tax=Pseudoteredinibacter isoporae TaxID=570281 RepID=A0A7X0MU88_9GAMM|nr:YceI family protein [Pseudoteredinibacter isoporae]MBB6519750.1 polyisoprenoid-binding protein YceI [Pseudoteredinibacter isoporae]NHO85331.1 YceI family protein [Pseudoteredinibacter isoporae]NIB26217.1 YceI family protein [Pseudoteredinibacter isoporae]